MRKSLALLYVWWFFWLLISYIDPSDFGFYSSTTFLLFGSSMILSFLFSSFVSNNKCPALDLNDISMLRFGFIDFFVGSIVALFFFKAELFILTNGADSLREVIRLGGDDIGQLFFSNRIFFLFNFFVPSFVLAKFFVSCSGSGLHKNLLVLAFYSSLLLVLDLVFLSRIYSYTLFLVALVYLIDGDLQMKYKIYISSFCLLLLAIILGVTVQRYNEDFFSMLKVFIIDYHTIGLHIFDTDFFQHPSSPVFFNSNIPISLSFLTFIPEYLYAIFFDSNYIPVLYRFNEYNAMNRIFFDTTGNFALYNAFATNLWSIYYDFDFIGVAIVSICFGLTIGYCSNQSIRRFRAIYIMLLVYGLEGFFNPMYLTPQANIFTTLLFVFFFTRQDFVDSRRKFHRTSIFSSRNHSI